MPKPSAKRHAARVAYAWFAPPTGVSPRWMHAGVFAAGRVWLYGGELEDNGVSDELWSVAPPGRGAVYVAVVHNRDERNFDAVSVVSGFPDVTSSNAMVEIEGHTFELLPFGNAAFVRAGKPEQDIIAAMSRPGSMKVVWTSSIDGTTIVDNYSLQGFRESKAAADRACGRPSSVASR